MATKINICHCISCQRGYPVDRFYRTKSNATFLPEGVIPYCEDCCEEIYNYYLSKTQDVQEAYRYTCAKMDIPFIQKVYNEVTAYNEKQMKSKKKNKENPNEHMFRTYYMFLWGEKSLETDIDKWEDYSDSDVPFTTVVKTDNQGELDDYTRFELDWGKQDYEDYQFLEYRFDYWTKDKVIDRVQEEYYRQLCLIELRKRKKESNRNEGGIGESTKEEQELIMKLIDKLKIANFEEVKQKSLTEQMIENQIYEIENKEPCEVIDREFYKDYCDIGKNWGKQVLRAVRNILSGSAEFPNINDDMSKW